MNLDAAAVDAHSHIRVFMRDMNLEVAAVDAHSHIRVFRASALASFPPSSRARGAIATTAPLHALSNLSCTRPID